MFDFHRLSRGTRCAKSAFWVVLLAALLPLTLSTGVWASVPDAPVSPVGPPGSAPCVYPNVEATVVKATTPDYPAPAKHLGLGPVEAQVLVTIDQYGNLISASIYKSSGNRDIDAAAIKAVRASKYSPKLVDCHPTLGHYLFRAEFLPDTDVAGCATAAAAANDALAKVRRAKTLLSAGNVNGAFATFKLAMASVKVAFKKECQDSRVVSRVATAMAAMTVFIGPLAFDTHQDSQARCEDMHWESGRFYAALSWEGLTFVAAVNKPPGCCLPKQTRFIMRPGCSRGA